MFFKINLYIVVLLCRFCGPCLGNYSLSSQVRGGGALAKWVRALAWTGDRTVPDRVRIPRRKTLAIAFTPLCQCLSEKTLKAVGSFYLVSMPGEVKGPTSLHWNV